MIETAACGVEDGGREWKYKATARLRVLVLKVLIKWLSPDAVFRDKSNGTC
jgi:hypothetical protein